MEVLTYDNKLNLNNYITKNHTLNTIDNQTHSYLENIPILKNKFLYAKRRANSQINFNFKSINFIPRENTVSSFFNNYNYIEKNKDNLNTNSNITKSNDNIKIIRKKLNKKHLTNINKITKNNNKSLSNNKNTLNNIARPCITESQIDSISNKIKKESYNYISKRIFNLIHNNKNNTFNNSSKKNNKNIIKSLKKNTINLKKKIHLKKRHNNNNNKLITSLEKDNPFNKDALNSLTINSNLSNNAINKNKVNIHNIKKNMLNLYTSPNSIKKNISFKQYLNSNFATINNAHNYQLYSHLIDIKKRNINAMNTIDNNKSKKVFNNNGKYIYSFNSENQKLNTISGFRNKKMILNKDDKKKILMVKKIEINKKNIFTNKNIINFKNNKNINANYRNKKKGESINKIKIKEFEKIKIINPSQALYTTNSFLTNNKTIKINLNNIKNIKRNNNA
jgi:hypothetical protein